MKVKIIIACLLMILATGFAYAKDIHVPGDFDKIQDALDAALPGDRVLVDTGTYEENITLISGVELLGAGADVTTIMASTGTVVTAENIGFRAKISGFTIDGVDKSGSEEHGIYCNNSSPTLSSVTITNTGGVGIYCWDKVSSTISNVTITNTGRIGIYCGASSYPTVSNVTITNTGESGILCSTSSPTISNVTITGAKSDGISCQSLSEPKIRGSVISQNFLNGIGIYTDSLPDIGTEAEPGGNSIFDNEFFDVSNGNPTEVKAELNWWGECPPNPAYFSGKVDYDPWLCTSINGHVTDPEGNPIKWAFVIAINADTKDKYKAFTKGDGYYEIPDLPFGTYWVICIKKGYKTGIKKVEVPPGEAYFVLTPNPE
ncbi:right-handed parallel beta-helix repeat-containing protein [bacterium]|nr:right-handed parallel beta-helix repeat-containing protein [bacterium]